MKIKGSTYFSLLIIAAMLVVIYFSLGMQYNASKFLPIIFASVVIVLQVIQLVKEKETDRPEGGEAEDAEGWREYLRPMAWVFGFAVGIGLLGFIVAMPLFVGSFTRSEGMGWRGSIALAVATVLVIYGAFEVGLGLILYRGLIYGLVA